MTLSNYQQKPLRKGQKMSNSISGSKSDFILIWHDGQETHSESMSDWQTDYDAVAWVENHKVLYGFVAWYTVLDRQTGETVYHGLLNEIA
jgi:hypothetical protein